MKLASSRRSCQRFGQIDAMTTRRLGSVLCWNDQSDLPVDWNGPIDRPFDAFPDESKARPIIELLQEIVHRYPERIALAEGKASIIYAELWSALAGWAEQSSAATARGDLIGIQTPVSTSSRSPCSPVLGLDGPSSPLILTILPSGSRERWTTAAPLCFWSRARLVAPPPVHSRLRAC
jgi:hypothetical protein